MFVKNKPDEHVVFYLRVASYISMVNKSTYIYIYMVTAPSRAYLFYFCKSPGILFFLMFLVFLVFSRFFGFLLLQESWNIFFVFCCFLKVFQFLFVFFLIFCARNLGQSLVPSEGLEMNSFWYDIVKPQVLMNLAIVQSQSFPRLPGDFHQRAAPY